MLRKSLFLLLTVALAAGLMFVGCQQDVEYRDVPGPTVEIPGPAVEVPGSGYPVPGEDVPVYVTADITIGAGESANLRAALLNPDCKVIAVNGDILLKNNDVTDSGDLVIPAGKSLYLYAGLGAASVTPPITIDVQGNLVVGYQGVLSAGAEHQVKVSGEGAIKVLDAGVLETDVPASVNDGAATVLGTPQAVIAGYGKNYGNGMGDAATLRYTNAVLSTQWALELIRE